MRWTPPTYNSTVIAAFRNKTCTNAIPMGANPYGNGSLPTPNATNDVHVCAVKYEDERARKAYALRTYASAAAAVADGAHVSHLHACGACSTLADLATYMDGKAGAEDLVAKIINDPSLLNALAAAPAPQTEE